MLELGKQIFSTAVAHPSVIAGEKFLKRPDRRLDVAAPRLQDGAFVPDFRVAGRDRGYGLQDIDGTVIVFGL